jgi:hypothetical protein
MSGKETAAITAMVLAVFALIIGAGLWERSEDIKEARQDAADVALVNRICGSRPKRVEYSQPGWSNGPRWEVFCTDGTVQVVLPGMATREGTE